jgi:hypothetical protein
MTIIETAGFATMHSALPEQTAPRCSQKRPFWRTESAAKEVDTDVFFNGPICNLKKTW